MQQGQLRDGLRLLRQPDFARLFGAYLVSYFGTAMAPIALAFGVLELTGSTSSSAIVIAAATTGQVLMLLVGGTLADRTSRHRLLVISDTIAATSQLTMAALFLTGNASVAGLAGLMLITGIAGGLHQPAVTGFIPQMVDRADLQAANALLGTARNGSITLGAALAGVLVATVGAGVTLAIDGLSFVLSGLLILSLRPRHQQTAPESATFIRDLVLGWKEFTRHKWLWAIVLQFSMVVAALDATFGLLGPAVARLHLGGPVAWGFIAGAMGLGTLTGGLLAIRLRFERPMLVGSILVLTFAIVPFTLAVPLTVPLIALGAFIGGCAGQVFGVLWYTALQSNVPAELLSRVSAYDHLGSVGLAPLGIVAAGYLFEWIGFRDTLLLCGLSIIVPTLFVLCVREVRELRPPAAVPLAD